MKIYEVGFGTEKYWVAANTVIEALRVLSNDEDVSFEYYEDTDDVVEMEQSKWNDIYVKNSDYDETDPDDWEEKTFAEFMDDVKEPECICSTFNP